MAPVVDGPGGFLPEMPQKLRESGNFMKGPIISGFLKDDGSFYTIGCESATKLLLLLLKFI